MISYLLKKLFARLSSPLPLREGLGVGLFLFLGSASVMAEGDPFGDYNPNVYSNTMTLYGHVYLNGEKLGTEAVVAAFCGSTLRGKQSPDDKGDLFLTIGGDYNNGDKLHFKVFIPAGSAGAPARTASTGSAASPARTASTGSAASPARTASTVGRVIEVDQNLTYTNNATVGSFTNPYIITLPTPIVTTPTPEGWATTCLPFNAEVPAGVEIWTATTIENHELVMTKLCDGPLSSVGGSSRASAESPAILPANTPVLLKSDGLTSYEWLSRVVDAEALAQQSSIFNAQSSILKGTTEPTAVAANSVLTLGYSNEGSRELGFWLFTGTALKANRAYIADFPAGTRGLTLRLDDYSGITPLDNWTNLPLDNCYDLSGRKWSNSKWSNSKWSNSKIKKGRHGQIIVIK